MKPLYFCRPGDRIRFKNGKKVYTVVSIIQDTIKLSKGRKTYKVTGKKVLAMVSLATKKTRRSSPRRKRFDVYDL